MAVARKASKAKTRDEIDVARKIWLAGVGAYGRMFTETQGALEKLAGNANQTFEQLVASGEQVEDAVRARIAKSGNGVERIIGSVAKQVKGMRPNTRFDERIRSVRKTVEDTFAPFNLGALAKSVDKLSDRVEALGADVAKLKAAKTRPAKK